MNARAPHAEIDQAHGTHQAHERAYIDAINHGVQLYREHQDAWQTFARAEALHNQAKALAFRAGQTAANPYTHDHAAIETLRTTKDVEDYLNAHTPGTAFRLEGAHVEAAKILAHEVADLAALHPNAMAQLRDVGITNDPRMARYIAHVTSAEDPEHPTFAGAFIRASRASGKPLTLLAPNTMANPKGRNGTQRVRDLQLASHFFADSSGRATEAGYVMRHEFGHHIEALLRNGGAGDAARETANYVYDRPFDASHGARISTYATKNAAEHWAEAFAGMKYGDQAHQSDPYVQALRDTLDAFG